MLELEKICAGYGKTQVLVGLSIKCELAKITTLLGRNGMGKTTAVAAIMGIVPLSAGTIWFGGQQLNDKNTFDIAQLGIAIAPEGRRIFPTLSVRENLIATATNYSGNPDRWNLARVIDFFPELGRRINSPGAQLSGGEQQMLSIGRALMQSPRLLILDEASEGLAPLIRLKLWRKLQQLQQGGVTILLIDKNIHELADIAARHYIIEKGKAVWAGNSTELLAGDLAAKYLGV